ncbi:MAG TPA: hypothetical protein VHR17_04555 [Thermoanaerobaculia bacterium]|nr:hypothetical protein [Thermoanaerobaculia bacterium]
MLTVRQRSDSEFTASLESFWGSSAKGDLLARATLVATVGTGRAIASAHTFFAGRAQPDVEIRLTREQPSADRSRVYSYEDQTLRSETIFRFAGAPDRFTYQTLPALDALPSPEDLPSEVETAKKEGWARFAVGPIESRRIGEHAAVDDGQPAVWQGWLRPRQPLPADTRVQTAALAFLSEYRSHWGVELRLGADFPRSDILILDHSLWIHRSVPWEDFWLVRTSTDVGVGGRCFSRREIFTRAGAMVASAAWEAVVRR